MSLSFPTSSIPSWDSSTSRPIPQCSSSLNVSAGSLQVVAKNSGGGAGLCRSFCGLKLWVIERFNLWKKNREFGPLKEFMTIKNQSLPDDSAEETKRLSKSEESSLHELQADPFTNVVPSRSHSLNYATEGGRGPSLCIAVIGATGELARAKIFPALFALYYSGFLPEDVVIFGYSRKDLTDEDLRSIIASTLTCRIDHQQNCGDKMEAFLSKTYYLNGGYDNCVGMSKLNARMEQIEGGSKANRIFYLSVPQEALLDVASCLADNAQTLKSWN